MLILAELSVVPMGLSLFLFRYPAINRWAMIFSSRRDEEELAHQFIGGYRINSRDSPVGTTDGFTEYLRAMCYATLNGYS